MCFTEAIAFRCVMQPGIKHYMLFSIFLKCKPEVTAELNDTAKNVNAVILAGKNIFSSHSLLRVVIFPNSVVVVRKTRSNTSVLLSFRSLATVGTTSSGPHAAAPPTGVLVAALRYTELDRSPHVLQYWGKNQEENPLAAISSHLLEPEGTRLQDAEQYFGFAFFL